MVSSYLEQKKIEYRSRAQQEKNQASGLIQGQILVTERQRQKPKSMSDSIPIGCCGSVVLLAVICTIGFISGRAIFLIGTVATLIFTAIAHSIEDSKIEKHNKELDEKIQELLRQETLQHRVIDNKYTKMMADEEARFAASVKASRAKYGGHAAVQPVVDWLAERFEKEIMNADRRSHNKNIEMVFAFRVDEHQVATLKKASNADRYGNWEQYDFNVNRFRNLPDYEDRAGFAQAIAKLVQFEIMRRFPQDPVAPSRARPEVLIAADDDFVELKYQAANPNYRPPVNL